MIRVLGWGAAVFAVSVLALVLILAAAHVGSHTDPNGDRP